MAEVILKKVEKIYPNGFKAVHGIDLHIKDGEFMVFVGPSGCAKSTTLRMIAGLEEITKGEIWIGDKLINNLPPKDRGIAMVFQNYALYPHMTVYKNMAFGLKVSDVPKDEIHRRVKEAAEKLEITDILQRKPKEISGGQRQRVALGRAIVRKPDVFLFDEPLSNLDAKLRVSTRVKITQLHKQLKAEGQKAAVIYVTHDQVEAMTMGDRICVLNHGKIMQVDTPLNLYKNPANKFTAGFIGSPAMNFIEGNIETAGENTVFIFGNKRRIILPEKMAERVKKYIGKKVIFGIRPENIEINSEEKENCFEGKINTVEYTGSEELIYFSIDEEKFTIRLETGRAENLSCENRGKFYFNIKKAHIFDIETDENITAGFENDQKQ